jgi:hypothetical protein
MNTDKINLYPRAQEALQGVHLMKLLANPLSQQAGKWLVMWLN